MIAWSPVFFFSFPKSPERRLTFPSVEFWLILGHVLRYPDYRSRINRCQPRCLLRGPLSVPCVCVSYTGGVHHEGGASESTNFPLLCRLPACVTTCVCSRNVKKAKYMANAWNAVGTCICERFGRMGNENLWNEKSRQGLGKKRNKAELSLQWWLHFISLSRFPCGFVPRFLFGCYVFLLRLHWLLQWAFDALWRDADPTVGYGGLLNLITPPFGFASHEER